MIKEFIWLEIKVEIAFGRMCVSVCTVKLCAHDGIMVVNVFGHRNEAMIGI